MTIKEAVELYNKNKSEIAEIDRVMKDIVARYKDDIRPMKRFELTEEEFSTVAGYVSELKAIKKAELEKQFNLDGKDSKDDT